MNETADNVKIFYLHSVLRAVTEGNPVEDIKECFLNSSSLEAKYDSVFKPLMETLRDDVLETAEKDPLIFNGYALPLQTACAELPPRDVPTLSVKDVCPTLSQCSSSFHSSTTNACGQNSKCDVLKAIPLMIGLFFYKVSFAFADKFCPGRCSRNNGCNMVQKSTSIAKQLDLIKAFVSMLP